MSTPSTRTIGLGGATGIGVGAIVGGGILALSGVALAQSGPGAIVAFALNGVIALVTALSFAEMSARFSESGGAYTFAKKVLTVEAAFCVGWVVWFASIVAAVLYALGFASFALVIVDEVWRSVSGESPVGLFDRVVVLGFALGAIVMLTLLLLVRGGGSGAWINVAKVLVFAVLIAGGLWAVAGAPSGTIRQTMTPFFPGGSIGLLQAMGFTFIALQGFDLIAAVAGEVREPHRNVPRAMFLSLGIAIAIYLPLLFIIATVGVEPGEKIAAVAAEHPETIVALAARNFLGPFGYWLVLAAGVLSMLSALQANLFAASRVAQSMARDRTLPHAMERVSANRRVPVLAILATAGLVAAVTIALPDVAAAGAAASLIFLVTFTLVHLIAILARRRAGTSGVAFRMPWYPVLPALGAIACVGLAAFQGVVVPDAGKIAAVWLGVGGVLFVILFARRARVRDAARQAGDPALLQLRGRSPVVLVPMANPARAEAMIGVAHMLAPTGVARVLLLFVVTPEREGGEIERQLAGAQELLHEALIHSHTRGFAPEALTTLAPHPWPEIARVARSYACTGVLLGMSDLQEGSVSAPLDRLFGDLDCNVVVLRSPPGWRLREVRRILVPVAGRSHHDVLRARLIGGLSRVADREVTYLCVVPTSAPPGRAGRVERILRRIVDDESDGRANVEVVTGDDVASVVADYAEGMDLVILGLQRFGRRRKVISTIATAVARRTDVAMLLISRRG